MIQQARSMEWTELGRSAFRQPYMLTLVLLVVAMAINYALQPNFFRPAILSGNLLTYLPLMLVAAGQTVVVLGGGIDLSVGAIVSLGNVVAVQAMGSNPGPSQVLLAVALGLLAGILAGGLNGVCVAYLRFQPIVTTFATGFVFAGAALWVLPRPGGSVPSWLVNIYRIDPLRIPSLLWVAAVLLLVWSLVRSTRYGIYLFAVGGDPMSAFVSGVPVSLVKLISYCIAGFMSALAGLAFAMGTGTGDPLIGGQALMLASIVAVVIGGTRLKGGKGSLVGSLIGVVLLGLIQSIVSFMGISNWWQTLINALIIIVALASPGIVALVRRWLP